MRDRIGLGLWILWIGALPLVLATATAEARRGSPGPGAPVWPRPGETDAQLYEKAVRLQARMWWHLSPSGLLVTKHDLGADASTLDLQALETADAAIWTGCYLASQVCRWIVTHDPDALAQVRHLAKGLAELAEVTGTPGRLVRSVGRVPSGVRPPKHARPSPREDGTWFRGDVSRDQLAGITFGWYWVGRYLRDDPELQALAARQLGAISRRLHADGMWLRDWNGSKTKHGELRKDVEYLPFVKNGPLAAIGFATAVGAAALNPGDERLGKIVGTLDGEGWDGALDDQFTFFANALTNSNVNMVVLSLTVLARSPHANGSHRARRGLEALRRASVGWWNGGVCACLLAAGRRDRDILGELRATLHRMPEEERPPVRAHVYEDDGLTPIDVRTTISPWAWKEDVRRRAVVTPGAARHPTSTYTRADWLFAYWLARSTGWLTPRVGPGARDPSPPILPDLPPWRRAPAMPQGGDDEPSAPPPR